MNFNSKFLILALGIAVSTNVARCAVTAPNFVAKVSGDNEGITITIVFTPKQHDRVSDISIAFATQLVNYFLLPESSCMFAALLKNLEDYRSKIESTFASVDTLVLPEKIEMEVLVEHILMTLLREPRDDVFLNEMCNKIVPCIKTIVLMRMNHIIGTRLKTMTLANFCHGSVLALYIQGTFFNVTHPRDNGNNVYLFHVPIFELLFLLEMCLLQDEVKSFIKSKLSTGESFAINGELVKRLSQAT